MLGRNKTGGLWDKDEREYHINYLEMKAVFLGLQSLCGNITQKHIRILSDNTTTVAYINAMGGVKSQGCNEMAQQIWDWCIQRDIWLSACHIPGVQNSEADTESRKFNESTEWSLDSVVFDSILALWGPFQIDLFASRLNFKVANYVSWKPDPGATFINAFLMNWQHHYFYAFPPFSLISTCLQKIEQDQASGVLLVPVWKTQPWFTILLHLLIDKPRLLASVHGTVGTTTQQCSSSTEKSNAIDGMQGLREAIKQRGISGKAAEIILRSWSESTHKQYEPYIKRWTTFCDQREITPFDPSVTSLLDFLIELHEKGLAYSTLNTARSAISAFTIPKDNSSIGGHPTVIRFMKGVYKSTPPTPRYKTTWDVQVVLTYLSSFPTVSDLPVKPLKLSC